MSAPARRIALEAVNLRKVYRTPQVVANDRIDFSVALGETLGVLGHNGAGKSTLVRQLVGLATPTGGEVRLFGEVVRSGRVADPRIGRAVAYLPQEALALGDLRVGEAIRWTGMLRGLGKASVAAECDEIVDALELGALHERPLRKLSVGQRRLVQLGMTLVGRWPIIILDEPTADIDPSLRRRIWELIRMRAAAGAAVLLVTHDVAEAEQILGKVAIMNRGRIMATGSPDELKADLVNRTRLELVVSEDAPVTAAGLAEHLPGDPVVAGRHVSVWVPSDDAVRSLEKVMAAAGADALEDVRLTRPTLEDVYLELADRSLAEDAAAAVR